MQDAGWEIASHGLRWIDYRNHTREAEKADLDEAIRLHTEVTGEPPRGWYTGRTSVNTVDLVSETGRFDWIADTYDDDLPYWREHGGRQQLIIPYSLESNDMRFSAGTFHNADDYFAYLRDTFDVLHAEGEAGAPEDDVRRPALPPRRPPRPHQGASPTSSTTSRPRGAWIATRVDIAAHWRSPPPGPADRRPPDDARQGRLRRPLRRRSTSTRPGSPSAPTPSSSARPTTPPSASPTPWPAPSARPPRTSASASSPPTPTSPASSPPPSA